MLGTALALMVFGLNAAAPLSRQGQEAPAPPLSFASKRAGYEWDRIIPLDLSVDGLSVKSIFFNKRGIAKGPLRGATFGARARVEVANTSDKPKNAGFAVAVFDGSDNLLGVASGGNVFGVVRSGRATAFDLNFFQVKERLQRGAYFVVSVELID
jgi:hypothetical protein